jgi:hypothetical protein
MHNRIVSVVLGGLGLFASVLGFSASALSPGAGAGGVWGTVMAFGIVAFLGSVFGRTEDK